MKYLIILLLLCSGCSQITLLRYDWTEPKKEEWVVVKQEGSILGVMLKSDAKDREGVEPLDSRTKQ